MSTFVLRFKSIYANQSPDLHNASPGFFFIIVNKVHCFEKERIP